MSQSDIAMANAERVREAAARQFVLLGDRITMDDVATAAGVSKGTVYKTYSTRESLVSSLTISYYEATINLIENERKRRTPVLEILAKAIVEPVLGPAAAPRVMQRVPPEGAVGDAFGRVKLIVDELIRQGIAEGSIRADLKLEHFTILVRGMYLAIDDGADRRQTLEAMSSIVIRGIAV